MRKNKLAIVAIYKQSFQQKGEDSYHSTVEFASFITSGGLEISDDLGKVTN